MGVPTFILVNIARLITQSGKSKVGFLCDQAIQNNSMFVGVTESWLHSGILDSEVTHDFPGYSLLRADRSGGRQGGGVALYIRDDLTGDILATFANSVCELLVVKIHQLEMIVCVAYRPPDTRISEFNGLLKSLDETLSSLPAHCTKYCCKVGDFNLPHSAITWQRGEEGLVVPVVGRHREGETAGGKQDRLQAQHLVDLANKHCLLQEVLEPTHGIEVLDLVFTNNSEIVSGVKCEGWSCFTDHHLVLIETSLQLGNDQPNYEEQFLCDTGRRYGALDFHKAPWEEVKASLGEIDWSSMELAAQADPKEALVVFHEKTLEVLEKLVPAKSTRSKRRPRMSKMRKLIWKRLAKVRKSILLAPSIPKLTELLQRQWELEAQLSSDYTAIGNREEDEAVMRIKENPKAFFSFARSRQKIKAKVGPFLDEKGVPNSSPDFAAETLRQQYNSVFATPRPAWTVTNFSDHFNEQAGAELGESLTDIQFEPKDIEMACADLKGTAAAGPDGVPAVLLKTCRKELSKPIYHLWRSSLNKGCIPPELLLVLICPIHKGGSRSVAKNYRPVALTSHLIKCLRG